MPQALGQFAGSIVATVGQYDQQMAEQAVFAPGPEA
jgi:hypothetical protein